jgi:uncharacterized protein YecE (DUF72 family)
MNIQIGTCGYSDEELKTPAGQLEELAADHDRFCYIFNNVAMFADAGTRRSLLQRSGSAYSQISPEDLLVWWRT